MEVKIYIKVDKDKWRDFKKTLEDLSISYKCIKIDAVGEDPPTKIICINELLNKERELFIIETINNLNKALNNE